jgi:ATP-dependent Clp protease ATP-binding subunit ClpA
MDAYNVSERARAILSLARQEAANFGHASVTPEHILLALVRDAPGVGPGVATSVLANLGVNRDAVRHTLEQQLRDIDAAAPAPPPVPLAPQSTRILELAMKEARELGTHTSEPSISSWACWGRSRAPRRGSSRTMASRATQPASKRVASSVIRCRGPAQDDKALANADALLRPRS